MQSIQDPELLMLQYQQSQMAKQSAPRFSMQGLENHVLFELAFRPFFILATFASLLALVMWILLLNGNNIWQASGINSTIWHIHEMLFGFAATVAVGFILTAAQTWTKQKSISGRSLMFYTLLWLAIRFCFYYNTSFSITLAVFLQCCWWFVAIWVFYAMVKKSNNSRNFLFVPLLTAMMMLNTAILVTELTGHTAFSLHLSRAGILLFTLLITILAGRVIPFFTQNGAKTTPILVPKWLEVILIPMSLLTGILFILSYFIDFSVLLAPMLIALGCLHLLRLVFWKTVKTYKVPLLWSLHLAYFFMSIGLVGLGLSYNPFGFSAVQIPFSSALHVITVGTIGLMIFAMMSRVSLGHTGRMLVLNNLVVLAFVLLILATLIRAILPMLNLTMLSWNLSALLWMISAVIFLFIYVPILTKKRQH